MNTDTETIRQLDQTIDTLLEAIFATQDKARRAQIINARDILRQARIYLEEGRMDRAGRCLTFGMGLLKGLQGVQ